MVHTFRRFSRQARATKATFGAEELSVPTGSYIRCGTAEISPGRAIGTVATDAFEASWELTFTDRHEELRHLPTARMYSAPIPRTKLLSPHPGALWSGELDVGGERVELRKWPGMVGHNWGAEHAERWVWLHAPDPGDEGSGDYLDVGAGRLKLGPVQTPWIANGMLILDGRPYRLGGIGRMPRTRVDARPERCEFVLPGKDITVRGSVGAPRERFVGWIYADPDGSEHNTVNCSIADMELWVERPQQPPRHLKISGAAAYELGMRETDHGIDVQPYPDGLVPR